MKSTIMMTAMTSFCFILGGRVVLLSVWLVGEIEFDLHNGIVFVWFWRGCLEYEWS